MFHFYTKKKQTKKKILDIDLDSTFNHTKCVCQIYQRAKVKVENNAMVQFIWYLLSCMILKSLKAIHLY